MESDREAALESVNAELRVGLSVAADALRSAARYLRYVHAFTFAEQVEIDERRARAALRAAEEDDDATP